MTQEEFESKIPALIIHPSHGELYRRIQHDKKDKEILFSYRNDQKHNTYGTVAKTFQELFDDLYPFLVKEGHIKAD